MKLDLPSTKTNYYICKLIEDLKNIYEQWILKILRCLTASIQTIQRERPISLWSLQ